MANSFSASGIVGCFGESARGFDQRALLGAHVACGQVVEQLSDAVGRRGGEESQPT